MTYTVKLVVFLLSNLFIFATVFPNAARGVGLAQEVLLTEPDPGLFDAISKQYNLLISDSPVAIERARKEQINSIALSYGAHDRVSLLKARPLYICDTADELNRLLSIPDLSTTEIKKINENLSVEVIDFKALDGEQQRLLVEEIYCVYTIALKGREINSFKEVALFDKMNPDSIQVVVWRNGLKKVVGFLVTKRHDLTCLRNNMDAPDSDNRYAVFKFYVCGLPECAGNGMMEYQKKLFKDYHINNPNVNVLVFEYSVNHKSFKKACYTNLFYPFIDQENSNVNAFVEFLKHYFGYESIDKRDPYVIKATSRPVMEVFLDPEDKLGNFYADKTNGIPNAGLLFFCCIYLNPNNSLGLPGFKPDWL